MKISRLLLGLTTAALMTVPAMAQDAEVYAGVGVDSFDFDLYTLSGRLGANFSEYFGVEGQAGIGIVGDSETETFAGETIEAELDIDFFGAAFLTARYPVSPQFDLVGRAGYYFVEASAEATAAGQTFEESGNTDGIALSAGGQFNFGDDFRNGIRAEYTYLDGDGGNGDAFSVAFIRKF